MSITLIMDMAVAAAGDRLALGRRADGLTFADTAARAGGIGRVAVDSEASHLVLIARNGPHFAPLIFGAALAGIPFVPLNYRLSPDAVASLLDDLPDALVILEDHLERYFAPVVEGRRHRLLGEFLASAGQAEPLAQQDVDGDDPAVLLYTSGTTSRPKAVVLTHQNLLSYILSTVDLASAGEEEAALVSVPPYHVAGIGSALSNFYAGRRVVHLPDFDPVQWIEVVRDEQVTSAMLVPTMLARVVEALGGDEADAPTLGLISYGGAKMPRPVLEKALRAFPGAGFCNAYGLTETSSTLALLGPEDHRASLASDDPAVRDRLGSVGRPVPGIEIQVRGVAGEVLGASEVGELYVRGPQVSGQYVGLGSALDAEGWFATRDQAYVDGDGYLFICGRSDDTIIRGGENISPSEVEEVLFEHPAVRDAVVIGVPDEEWGQRLVAVLVGNPGAKQDGDDVRRYVRSRLRGSRTPDDVAWVEELPVTATGKILRRELVAQFS